MILQSLLMVLSILVQCQSVPIEDPGKFPRPSLPRNVVPKPFVIPNEEDATGSEVSKISVSNIGVQEQKSQVDRPTAVKALFGNETEAGNDLETVRSLLAEYREKVAKAHTGEETSAKKVEAVSDARKKQIKMRAAEIKALDAKQKRNQKPKLISELNLAYTDYLHEGDILLTVEQAKTLLSDATANPATRAKRSMINFANQPRSKWNTSEPIAFAFDSSVDSLEKARITKAILWWAQRTCFDFEETTVDDNTQSQPILTFHSGDDTSCNSNLGKLISRSKVRNQVVNLGGQCLALGIMTHEIGHAFGFYHTQSRYDRDDYVIIDYDNIRQGDQAEFEKLTSQLNDNHGVKYDYGSVMHYDAKAAAKDRSKPSIIPKEPHMMNTMGQQREPAFSDLLILNRAYNCLDECSSHDFSRCQNGGFPSPKSCDHCVCPKGFGGQYCTERDASTGNSHCSGATLTATPAWQSFTGLIDPGLVDDAMNQQDFEYCHWHINSPNGTRISLFVDEISNDNCNDACPVSSVEFKDKEWTRTGVTMCCQSDLGEDGYVIFGVTNKVVVSLQSRSRAQSFAAYYKYV